MKFTQKFPYHEITEEYSMAETPHQQTMPGERAARTFRFYINTTRDGQPA